MDEYPAAAILAPHHSRNPFISKPVFDRLRVEIKFSRNFFQADKILQALLTQCFSDFRHLYSTHYSITTCPVLTLRHYRTNVRILEYLRSLIAIKTSPKSKTDFGEVAFQFLSRVGSRLTRRGSP